LRTDALAQLRHRGRHGDPTHDRYHDSNYGQDDAPDFAPFNGDPASLPGLVDHPECIVVLAPGEPHELRRLL
jgi:hypothetical protein